MPGTRQREPVMEDILQEGCRLLREQVKPDYMGVKRLLVQKYNVDVSYYTLRNRFLNKHKAAHQAHETQMLLSPSEELVLVEWITLLADSIHPISKRTIRKKAQIIAGKKPGPTWVQGFLKRHPEIQLSRPSGLDPKRAQAFNKPVVDRYFDLLEETIAKHDIPIENRYNMDEKGCQRGGGRRLQSQKYFVPRNKRTKYKARSSNLELVTIIECVCADGTSLEPGFVFQGTNASINHDGYFPEEYPHICVSTSENGWTDDHLCFEWFQKCFIPQAKARNHSGKPILLIYDGHGSHETLEMLRLAKKENIILFSLPPHTTHKLQPLDVGVFGPFSRAWLERCDEIIEETGQEMPREDFIREYMDVRKSSFKERTIRSAWRKSGATPVDRNVFTDIDYAPSLATSYANVAVPPSFPVPITHDDQQHQSWSDDDQNASSGGESGPNTEIGLQLSGRTCTSSVFSTNTPVSLNAPPLSQPQSLTIDPCPSPSTIRRSSRMPVPIRRAGRTGTEAYITDLEMANDALSKANDMLRVNCLMAREEIKQLKRAVNKKDPHSRQKRRKLNVDARVLTRDEYIAQREKENDERVAEDSRKAAERQAKEDEQNERHRIREQRDRSLPFTGSLKLKVKDDLLDIIYSLELDIHNRKKSLASLTALGTKSSLIEHIHSLFDANSNLKTHPRYCALKLNLLAAHSETSESNFNSNFQLPDHGALQETSHRFNTIHAHNSQYSSPYILATPGPSSTYIPTGYI